MTAIPLITGETRLDRWSATLARLFAWLTASHWRASAALVLLCLALFLPGQFSLQPMDRDEPRFAQATKQMLETRDFIDIRFQDEARHKKPVGIYWMQAAVVSAAETLGVPDARRTIGLYRVPSWIGATIVVLATYATALAFLSAPGALAAAMLMAATVILGVEARLAKTDAVLTATIVTCFAVFARIWFAHASPATRTPPRLPAILLFWVAMGIGILVKGPIAPMIVGLAAVSLSFRERSARWLLALRPWLGLAIVAIIVLPWLAAIAIKSGGAFFEASLGDDMIAKVGQGQEKHWGPPGLYLLLFWATAWPLAVFVAMAFRFMWIERKDDAVAFLLAWVLPSWIVFEIVQTKLPHYVMPLYPALAILAIMALERHAAPLHWRSAKATMLLFLLVPLALLGAGTAGFWYLDRTLAFFALPFILAGLALAVMATVALWRQKVGPAVVAAVLSSATLVFAAWPFGMPEVRAINLSKRLAEAAHSVPCVAPAFATAGYNEPSLVFLTDTEIDLTDGKGAARHFAARGCRIAFVDARREADFQRELAGIAEKPRLVTRITGLNINGGRQMDIGVYARER
jgi:4-amino-4-deoxy-L-arabinose transferase-like glycosyltransferase